jgi:hypothetical protein
LSESKAKQAKQSKTKQSNKQSKAQQSKAKRRWRNGVLVAVAVAVAGVVC